VAVSAAPAVEGSMPETAEIRSPYVTRVGTRFWSSEYNAKLA